MKMTTHRLLFILITVVTFLWCYRTIFTLYAELYYYEFTSRGREEADKEKLKRWKREQALFMQRWPEFFVDEDTWLNPNLISDSEYFAL